jgi:chemotaxis protein MotB
MSKKKHPEHVSHERWLVSYADFITLLFAFFVVLFASGQSDKSKQKKIGQAITSAFAQTGIFLAHSTTPAIADSNSGGFNAAPIQLPLETPADIIAASQSAHTDVLSPGPITPLTPAQIQQQVLTLIKKQIAAGALQGKDISLRPTAEGITLSLHEGGFFDSGSATIHPASLPTLQAIAATLANNPLRIEGHTDNVPITSALYASNWELSTARACAIARFLIDNSHANPTQIAVAGYAEFHPIASNATPEGRAKNRRVDIVFLQATPAPPAITTAPLSAKGIRASEAVPKP